jgi:hypothetical protein
MTETGNELIAMALEGRVRIAIGKDRADSKTFLAAGFTAAQALEVIVDGAVSLLANYTNHVEKGR